jgi:hypothetical protein
MVVSILDAFIAHEMNRLALPFDRCLGCVPGINESAPVERDLEFAPVVSGEQIRFVR